MVWLVKKISMNLPNFQCYISVLITTAALSEPGRGFRNLDKTLKMLQQNEILFSLAATYSIPRRVSVFINIE